MKKKNNFADFLSFFNANEILILSISLLLLLSPHLFFGQIAEADNSVIISGFQFFSDTVDNFLIEINYSLFGNYKLNLSNNFLISYFHILLNYIGIPFYISKKIFFFILVIYGTCGFYELTKIFFQNKLISYFCSLIFAISPGFIDFYIMGWDYAVFALYLSPSLIYYIIKYFNNRNYLNFYLSHIFLILVILLISIQNIFLVFVSLLFLTYYYKDRKFFFFIIFFLICTLISIIPQLFSIFYLSPNFFDNTNINNSSISKGLLGVINPFYNFIHFNNFVNNYSLSFSKETKIFFLNASITAMAWIGWGLCFYRGVLKNKYYLFFFIFFLLEFFLFFLYKIVYYFYESNSITLFNMTLSVFRDPARLGGINNFLIYIYLGYFLYVIQVYLQRIKSYNFVLFYLILLLAGSLYLYKITYSFKSIKYENFSNQFIEKENFLKSTNLSNILILPLKTNVNLTEHSLNNANIITIDPLKRFNMNKIFTWNTDKSNDLEKNLYICDQKFKDIKEKILCFERLNLNLHYIIEKSFFKNPKDIIKFQKEKNNLNYNFYSFDFFILLENSANGSYKEKYETYGLKKVASNLNNYCKINNIYEFETIPEHNLKNFFKIKFISIYQCLNTPQNIDIKNKIFYPKKQLYFDLIILFTTIIFFLNLSLILIKLFKKD